MINDREFSSPGEEFNPPAPEFARPGPEQNRSGREFGQPAGEAAPPKKRRRVPGFMFAAAAVVTATVALSAPAPAEFPQPENFTAEYRAYLDEIMETCETEDPVAVHRLATDPLADEFWTECMEPYVHEVVHRGFSYMFYYDGEEMTPEPGAAPALYFWHNRFTPEETDERNTLEYHTQLTYFRDGSQRNQKTWGLCYRGSYGLLLSELYAPPFSVFCGEMTQVEDSYYLYMLYHQGTDWQYNNSGWYDDTLDTVRLDRILSGEFSNEKADPDSEYSMTVHYLENGIWTQNFASQRIDYGTGVTYRKGGKVETQVVDGSIVPNEYVEPEPADQPGLYWGISVQVPDGTGGSYGWSLGVNGSFTLEELLYHSTYTTVYN